MSSPAAHTGGTGDTAGAGDEGRTDDHGEDMVGPTETGGAGEQALVRRVAAGDPRALQTLFDRYVGPAYALAERVMGDPDRAAEVVLDTFLSLREGPPPGGCDIAAWVFDAIHRHAVDTLRREAPSRRRLDAAVRDIGRLRDVPGELPLEQREVLVLAYLGGHTAREVATLTDAPPDSVRLRMLAAMRRLTALLGVPPTEPPTDGGHEADDALAIGWSLHALEPDEEARVAAHMPDCARCRSLVATTEVALGRLALALPADEPPAGLRERLTDRLHAATEPSREAPGDGSAAPPDGHHEVNGEDEGLPSLETLQRVVMWCGVAVFLALCVAVGIWYVAFRN